MVLPVTPMPRAAEPHQHPSLVVPSIVQNRRMVSAGMRHSELGYIAFQVGCRMKWRRPPSLVRVSPPPGPILETRRVSIRCIDALSSPTPRCRTEPTPHKKCDRPGSLPTASAGRSRPNPEGENVQCPVLPAGLCRSDPVEVGRGWAGDEPRPGSRACLHVRRGTARDRFAWPVISKNP